MSDALRKALIDGNVRLAPDGSRSLRAAEVPAARVGDGTIEMIVATSAPVTRTFYDWDSDEFVEYDEVLPVSAFVLPEQSGRTINLLDSHNWWSTSAIIGVGEAFRTEGERIFGTFRLSKRSSVADIVEGIREGIICNGSCGYRIDDYVLSEANGRLTLTATKVTLFEMSVVPVPADGESGTVGARSASELLAAGRAALSQGKRDMTKDEIVAIAVEAARAAVAAAAPTPADPAATGTGTADAQADPAGGDAARGAQPQNPNPVQRPAAGQRSAEDLEAITHLRGVAKRYGVEADFEDFVKAGAPVDQLRSVAMTGFQARGAGPDTDGSGPGRLGKRKAEFLTHDEAVSGRRSGETDVTALASVLAAALGNR